MGVGCQLVWPAGWRYRHRPVDAGAGRHWHHLGLRRGVPATSTRSPSGD